MTPREDLAKEMDSIVGNYKASRQDTRKVLQSFAIGKWVSVEEQLPEFEEGRWKGCLKNGESIYFGVFHHKEFMHGYDWLDLSLPEVES